MRAHSKQWYSSCCSIVVVVVATTTTTTRVPHNPSRTLQIRRRRAHWTEKEEFEAKKTSERESEIKTKKESERRKINGRETSGFLCHSTTSTRKYIFVTSICLNIHIKKSRKVFSQNAKAKREEKGAKIGATAASMSEMKKFNIYTVYGVYI